MFYSYNIVEFFTLLIKRATLYNHFVIISYFIVGSQWLNTMNLPSHTRDSDLNLLNMQHTRFLNSIADGMWGNITMRLDTTEVRGHKFYVDIRPYWPSLLVNSNSIKNKSVLMFPLTQVGNTSYRVIKLHNPSTSPLLIQLVMDWSYPQGARLYHSLPIKYVRILNLRIFYIDYF